MSMPVRRRAGIRDMSSRGGAPGGRGGWRGPFGWSAWQTAAAVLAAVLVLFVVFTLVVAASLPDPSKVSLRAGEIKILDRNQKVITDVAGGGEQRQRVKLEQISPLLQKATIDAEDRNFRTHTGVDVGRLIKATTVDLVSRRAVSGASTITEQLAKLTLLTPQGGLPGKTLTRKYKEAILATEIEQRYSKDEILTLYLNTIYYGHRAYGAQAAAKVYFEKDAKDLSLGQASLLAGLPQAPSYYDPARHYETAKSRQAYVLDQMERAGDITRQQADDAKAEDLRSQLRFKDSNATGPAPHFVEYIRGEIDRQYGREVGAAGGITVVTSLDMDVQNAAQAAVESGAAKNERFGANNAALLVEDPNSGEILAMVGSRDYNRPDIAGQVNIAGPETKRQPGSSFKPYVYATGIADRKYNTLTVFHDTADQARSMDPNQPVNDFDNRHEGKMRLRTALVESRNIPAEEGMQKAGPDAVVATAHKMGISTEIKPYLASAIGASEVTMLDHAEAYGVFATQGYKHDPRPILKLLDATGKDVTEKPRDKEQVMSAGAAFIISDVLKHYNEEWHLGFDRELAAKSGTTNIETPNGISTGDGWLMAYNQEVVIAAWGGHTSNDPKSTAATKNFFGVDNGQSIIAPFLKSLPGRWKKGLLPKPSDVTVGNCADPSAKTDEPNKYSIGGGDYLLAGDSASACPSPSPTASPSTSPSASTAPTNQPTPDIIPTLLPSFAPSPRPSPKPSPTQTSTATPSPSTSP
ncbi:MAG: transglycosylase domain-containing protein [Candidatus Dormibacteria bacterium]